MAKLQITLHENNGDVTYKQNHVSGQRYLDFWVLQEKIEKEQLSNVEAIELRLEYIASLFPDDDLTAEQILQGLDPWEIEETVLRLNNAVLGIEESDEKKEQ